MIVGTPRLRAFAEPNGSGKSVLKAVLPLPLLGVTSDPKATSAKLAQVRSGEQVCLQSSDRANGYRLPMKSSAVKPMSLAIWRSSCGEMSRL